MYKNVVGLKWLDLRNQLHNCASLFSYFEKPLGKVKLEFLPYISIGYMAKCFTQVPISCTNLYRVTHITMIANLQVEPGDLWNYN